MREFSVVVAADEAWGIGREGDLPWRLKGDMAWFRRLTVGDGSLGVPNTVIMGRRTWESIPERFRPLPDRHNVVVSSNRELQLPDGVSLACGLDEALEMASDGDVFVIGGGQLYAAALASPACTTVHLTRVSGVHDCDTYMPDPTGSFHQIAATPAQDEGGIHWRVITLVRPQH